VLQWPVRKRRTSIFYPLPAQSITTFVGTSSSTPGFVVTPTSNNVAIAQGGTGTDTITVTDLNGFTGSVNLSASGLPSGVTASFGTNPTTGTSLLTLTASSAATTGPATVTITGTSGIITATSSIALTVGVAPGVSTVTSGSYYTITNATSGQCINDPGGVVTNSTSVQQSACSPGNTNEEWQFTNSTTAGYDEIAAFASGTAAWNVIPNGVSAGTGIQLYSYSGASNEVFEPLLYGSTGFFEFIDHNSGLCVSDPGGSTVSGQQVELETCNGSAGELWALNVPAPASPGVTMTPSASSLTIPQGSYGTDTITLTDTGGFAGSVTLAATGLPTGVTVAYGTNPTTGSSVLTFTATAAATIGGPTTVTITGTSGTTTATTTIALTVTPEEYVFVVNGSGSVASLTKTGGAATGATTGGGIGEAIDAAGDVWSINSSGTSVSEFSNVGVLLSTYSGAGISAASALAIDGKGVVWIANSGSVSALTNAGAAVSTIPLAQAGNLSAPASISVDAAGSLWIANSGNNTVTEIIGVAAPVTTPVVTQVINSTPGTRP
jgi:hypothetical protein